MADDELKRLLEGLFSDISPSVPTTAGSPDRREWVAEHPDERREGEWTEGSGQEGVRAQQVQEVGQSDWQGQDLTRRLWDTARALSVAQDAGQVGQALVDFAAQVGVDAARLLLFSGGEEGRPTHIDMLEGWTIDGRPAQPYGTRLPLDGYPMLEFMSADRPLVCENVATDPRLNDLVRQIMAISGLGSFAIVPLSVGTQWLGSLLVGRNGPSTYADDLILVCWTLAGQAAVALQNIQRLGALQGTLHTLAVRTAEQDALIDTIPDSIYFKDAASRFTRVNPYQARMLGAPNPQAAIGKTDFDFFAPEFAQAAWDDEQRILKSGQPLIGRIEKTIRKDGREQWFSATKIPLTDVQGQVMGLVGISRDVTEIKEAQDALQRRSTELQLAAEISRAATGMLDPDELIRQAVNLIRDRFDLYYVGLFLTTEMPKGQAEAGEKSQAFSPVLPTESGAEMPVRAPAAASGKGQALMKGRPVSLQASRVQAVGGGTTEKLEAPSRLLQVPSQEFSTVQPGRGSGGGPRWAVLRAGTGEAGRAMLRAGHQLEVGGRSMIGWCIANAQARIALDVGTDPVRFDNPLLPETRSELALPLISRGRAIGALTIQSRVEAAFGEEDITVLQTMADQLANAIANARLLQERERRIMELAIVNEIGQAISSTTDLETLFNTVHRQIDRLFDVSSFYIATYEPGSDQWTSAYHVEKGVRQPEARYSVHAGITGWMIRNRQPLLFKTRQENIDFAQGQGIEIIGDVATSWLAAPLIAADKCVGVICVQSYDKEGLYDEQDQVLFSTVAGQVAVALDNLRLFDETRRRAGDMEAINEVGQAISSVLDLDAVLRQVVDVTKERFGGYFVSLLLVEGEQLVYRDGSTIGQSELRLKPGDVVINLRDGGGRRSRGGVSDPPEGAGAKRRAKKATETGGRGMSAEAVRTGRPVLAGDVATDPYYRVVPELAATRSELDVPIRAKGQVIGVLDLQSDRPFAYDETSVVVLQSLADQVGVAIDNARLFQEMEQRTIEFQALYDVAISLGTHMDRGELLRLIVEQAVALLDVEAGGFYLYEPYTDELVFSVATGYFSDYVGTRLKPGEGLAGRVFREGRPEAIGDYHAWGERAGVYDQEARLHSLLGVPLVGRAGVLGVLDIAGGRRKPTFGQQDIRLAELFAAQAATALDNLRLLEETSRRADQMEAMNEAGRVMTGLADLDTLLSQIADITKTRFGYYFVGIALTEGDRLIFRSGSTIGDSDARMEHGVGVRLDATPPIAGRASGLRSIPTKGSGPEEAGDWHLGTERRPSLIAETARTAQPVLVNDVRADPRYMAVGELPDTRSELDLPIEAKGQVIGVLTVQSDRPGAFGQTDVAVLQSLASQAGVAIDNARLFRSIQLAQAEEQRRSEQLAALQQASLEIAQEQRDLNTVLDRLSRQAMSLLDSDGGGVWLWREEDQELELVVSYQESGISMTGRRLKPGEGLTGRAFVDRQTQKIDDYLAWNGHAGAFQDAPFRAGLAVPMIWQNQAIGALVVTRSQPDRPFTASDQALAELLTAQATAFIQNARLFEEAQSNARELAVLNEMGRALGSMLDTKAVIENIYTFTGQLVDTTNFYVALYDAEQDEISFPLYVEGEQGRTNVAGRRAGTGMTEYIIRTQQPLLVRENIPTKQAELGIEFFGTPSQSWLGVPLIVAGQSIGVIAVQSYTTPRVYDEHDRDLLVAVAGQAAIAVQNARLFEERQRTAALLAERVRHLDCLSDIGHRAQESPPLPEFLQWVAGRIPAAMRYPGDCLAAIELGGDIYGVAEAPNTECQIVQSLRLGQEAVGDQRESRSASVVDRIYVAYAPEHEFADEESALLGEIVRRVSSYLENHRLIEETQEATRRLAEERSILRTVIDSLPDPIFVKDRQSRFIIDNTAHLQTLGATSYEEIAGLTDFDRFPEEIAAGFYADEQQVMSTGEPLINREEFILDERGGKRWLWTTKVPLRDSQGRITGIVGSNRDITERKQAEETLKRRGAQLECLSDIGRRSQEAPSIPQFLEWVAERIPSAMSYTDDCLAAIEFEGRLYGAAEALGTNHRSPASPAPPVPPVPTGGSASGGSGSAIEGSAPRQMVQRLQIGGETLGRMYVAYPEEREFADDESALLGDIVRRVSSYLENRRLFEQTQRALAQTQALYQASRSAAVVEDLPNALQEIADGVAGALPADRVVIAIIDPQRQQVLHHAWGGLGAKGLELAPFDELMTGLTGWVLREMKPALSPKGEPDPREGPQAHRHRVEAGSGAIVIVPLVYRGQTLGTLTAMNRLDQPDFGAEDVELMTAIGSQAAAVVSNARLFAQTQQALAQTQALYQASAQLNAAQSYHDILNALRANTFLGQADRSTSIELYDRPWVGDDVPDWAVIAARYSQVSTDMLSPRYPLKGSAFAGLLRPDAPALFEDLAVDPRLDQATRALYHDHLGARSGLIVPLVVGGQWIGHIDGLYGQTTRFVEDEVDRLMSLAGQAAVAVQSLRQFEQVQAALAEVEATHRRYLQGQWQGYLQQREDLQQGGFLYDQVREVSAVPDLWRPEMEQALQAAEPAMASEPAVASEPDGRGGVTPPGRPRAGLAVPIQVRGQTIGVLGIENPDADAAQRWSEDEIALLEEVSQQLALALENARLFEETQRRAERERLITNITARIRASTDILGVLETTATELGKALGTSRALVQLTPTFEPPGPDDIGHE